jgi:hypothetical protein
MRWISVKWRNTTFWPVPGLERLGFRPFDSATTPQALSESNRLYNT